MEMKGPVGAQLFFGEAALARARRLPNGTFFHSAKGSIANSLCTSALSQVILLCPDELTSPLVTFLFIPEQLAELKHINVLLG